MDRLPYNRERFGPFREGPFLDNDRRVSNAYRVRYVKGHYRKALSKNPWSRGNKRYNTQMVPPRPRVPIAQQQPPGRPIAVRRRPAVIMPQPIGDLNQRVLRNRVIARGIKKRRGGFINGDMFYNGPLLY